MNMYIVENEIFDILGYFCCFLLIKNARTVIIKRVLALFFVKIFENGREKVIFIIFLSFFILFYQKKF